jgi:hypothetical protein
MEYDRLNLFDRQTAEMIMTLDDAGLWDFLIGKEERIRHFTIDDPEMKLHPASGFLYAYPHGVDWLKQHFMRNLEEYREGVVYTLILDFCIDDEPVRLDYLARSGFLDNAESCDVRTSEEIMPPVDEDSEPGQYLVCFHLLEENHVENLIRTMETNAAKLTENTFEDIEKIRRMKYYCLKNPGFNVIYSYDI